MNFEYLSVFVSIFLSFFISFLLFLIILFFVYSKKGFEKSSSYECGFHPFEDTRQEFNIRFYLVSILFIIFDLEIVFLFP
jgi:NADH-quinone oxidoreductase subunit A